MRAYFWAAAVLLSGSISFAQTAPQATPKLGTWGVDLTDQDRTIRPGDDFSGFQNGAWLARMRAGSQPSSAYWRDVRIQTARVLGEMLDGIAHHPGGHAQKAGAFYRAAMDSAAAEGKGVAPLMPELDAIRAAASPSQFARMIGAAEGPGTQRAPLVRRALGRGLFTLTIAPDSRDPARYALYLGQGGLMLPTPDYYLDPAFADLKTLYQQHVARVLALIGWPDPEANAAAIITLETHIAAVQIRSAGDHPVSVDQLVALAPAFDWRAFLDGAGLAKVDRVITDSPDGLAAMASLYAQAPLALLQARQAYASAEIAAPLLNAALHDDASAFQAKVFQGLQANPSRAFDAEKWLEASLPDALGALYVAHYSSAEIRRRVAAIAAQLRRAMDIRLQHLAWMSPAARAQARHKLAQMQFHVGYPDRFDAYAGLEIRDDDLYGNVARATAYAWQRDVARLDAPVDRTQWQLTPFYPQYHYDVASNIVEIPAALLVPPFFDPQADDAVNYGGIGTVIGTTIASAFRPGATDYDAGDAQRLAAITAALAKRYSAETPLPGMHIRGELVAGEAMADIGGVQIAFDAYRAAHRGRAAPIRDGYTGDQRFFLGYAQMWRARFSDDFLRNQLATGSNAPPYMRINGPLPQIDGWYDAFGARPGDRLYIAPAERLRIW